MQDFDEQEMLFLRENILLSKVNGKIFINVIKADVGRVEGSIGWATESIDWVEKHVVRAESVGWVYGHVGRAGSVGSVGNEENES